MAFDQYNNEELLISLIHAWTKLFEIANEELLISFIHAWTKLFEIAKHVLILVKEF